MNWRIAEALVQMRAELDTKYPNRDRTSDGAIGDAAHATRTSDHNPWVRDQHNQPVVTAIDVDRDIGPGVTSRMLAEFLRLRKDARIKYVISNGQMFSSYSNGQREAWEWGPYTGANGHFEHCHISLLPNQLLYDSKTPWAVAKIGDGVAVLAPMPTPPSPSKPRPAAETGLSMPMLKLGSAGADVGYLQRMLGGLKDDNDFGPRTLKAVKAFQQRAGLDPSGVMDEATWIALRA